MEFNNYPSINMEIRNIRPRYPLTSEEVEDMMDEIYYNLSALLGYQNTSGNIAISGEYLDLLSLINSNLLTIMGAQVSGVAEALMPSSGVYGAHTTNINEIALATTAMLNNPYF
jgi:hypothetical protein